MAKRDLNLEELKEVFGENLKRVKVKNPFNPNFYVCGRCTKKEGRNHVTRLYIGYRYFTKTGKKSKVYPIAHCRVIEEGFIPPEGQRTKWWNKETTFQELKRIEQQYVKNYEDYKDPKKELAEIVVTNTTVDEYLYVVKEF